VRRVTRAKDAVRRWGVDRRLNGRRQRVLVLVEHARR
jgi:hypothetical protein